MRWHVVMLLMRLSRYLSMWVLVLGAGVRLGAVGGLEAGLTQQIVHGEVGGVVSIPLGVCLANHWHVHLPSNNSNSAL